MFGFLSFIALAVWVILFLLSLHYINIKRFDATRWGPLFLIIWNISFLALIFTIWKLSS